MFNEIIVVDTGSSDGTVALAKSLGAKVLYFKWIDDFSAARNFAITQCTGDWIFFLDADEYFKSDDVPNLRPLIEKLHRQFTSSNGRKRPYNVIETPWINVKNNRVARQARIFKNLPYLRYTGEVHEHLHALPGGYPNTYSAKGIPAIYHTGYAWSEDVSKEDKSARNFQIAQKALEKAPGCSKLLLFAAKALMFEGRYCEAERYFSAAMKNQDGSIWPERIREGYRQWLSNYMHREDSESGCPDTLVEAARVHSEAVLKFPNDADFDILLSLIYFKAKDIPQTIRFFSMSLSKGEGRLAEKLKSSNNKIYEKLYDICKKINGIQ